MKRVTYRSAGVDIDKANALVKDYKRFAKSTAVKGVISDIGSFGGLFRPDIKRFKDPIFVASTDGVGTKLKLAFLFNKHDLDKINNKPEHKAAAARGDFLKVSPARDKYYEETRQAFNRCCPKF